MIFIVLFSTLAMVAWGLRATLHDDSGRVPRLCSISNWMAQVSVLALGAMDWAYSVVEVAPYELLALGHLEWLAIFLPALALAILIPMRPKKRTAEAFLLHALQALAFIPVLLTVESKTSLSFLSWNTCIALTLSCSSVLLSLSPMLRHGAKVGGRFHEIAYKDRAALVAYIRDARHNLTQVKWSPPITFLDAGTFVGKFLNRELSMVTKFSLLPFGYSLDFRIALQSEQPSWLIAPKPPNTLVPEARLWKPTETTASPRPESTLHTPPETVMTETQLTHLSAVGATLRDQLLTGYLICTGDSLSYRLIDHRGLEFSSTHAQTLMSIAESMELPVGTSQSDSEVRTGELDATGA